MFMLVWEWKKRRLHSYLVCETTLSIDAKLQEDFDDANSQAYPRPTQEDFDFKKDWSSWIIQVNIKQSKIFK